MAHVTQEVTSQLAQAPAPTFVPDPAQPALRCSQPTTLAPVQPSSVAPTQQLSSLSSVQAQLSEVPVCSLGNAAAQFSVNSVFSHLTGELNLSSSLSSSLFTSSALPVDLCVSEKLKSRYGQTNILTLAHYLSIHCLRISIMSPFKILKGG